MKSTKPYRPRPPKGVSRKRTFSGKQYELYNLSPMTKRTCETHKSDLQGRGYSVRIVPLASGHWIYCRKK